MIISHAEAQEKNFCSWYIRGRYMSETTPEPSHTPRSLSARIKALLAGETAKLLGQETWNSLRIMLVLFVLCGAVFPLVVFGIGQLAFSAQANGSLITDSHDVSLAPISWVSSLRDQNTFMDAQVRLAMMPRIQVGPI